MAREISISDIRIGSLSEDERNRVATELANHTALSPDQIDRKKLILSSQNWFPAISVNGKRPLISDFRRSEPRTNSWTPLAIRYLRRQLGYRTDPRSAVRRAPDARRDPGGEGDIDEKVAADVRQEMAAFGVRLGAITLKDVILPGDMREILNQVVTAEKQAQANLIRRREETAATRALLNTAKLMEDNPLLVRLKELETLEKVAEKVEKITVGGFDALLSDLVTIRTK